MENLFYNEMENKQRNRRYIRNGKLNEKIDKIIQYYKIIKQRIIKFNLLHHKVF